MEFFRDHLGKLSTIRLLSFIALIAAIYFGVLTIKLSSEFGLYLCIVFITAAFVPKALQKYIELIPDELIEKYKRK